MTSTAASAQTPRASLLAKEYKKIAKNGLPEAARNETATLAVSLSYRDALGLLTIHELFGARPPGQPRPLGWIGGDETSGSPLWFDYSGQVATTDRCAVRTDRVTLHLQAIPEM